MVYTQRAGMRNGLVWVCATIAVATMAYVFFANVFPVVVLPSAANPPERTSVPSTTRPPLLVHAAKFPDSNPSANNGGAAAGVVTDAAGALSAERLPAASRARTTAAPRSRRCRSTS